MTDESFVQRIDILCECQGCQKRFGVEIETSCGLSNYKDFDAVVRDYVLGGDATCYTWGVRGKQTVDRFGLSGSPSIQADLLLCDVCTKKCDDLSIEENLTRKQVNEALGLGSSED
jgi:hypothetical protein